MGRTERTVKNRLIACGLVAATMSSCSNLVAKFAFYPDKTSTVPAERLPGFARLVSFETADKLKLQGLLFKHEPPNAAGNIIVYFHGNAGNMYHRIDEATELFDMGADVLVVSYRGRQAQRS